MDQPDSRFEKGTKTCWVLIDRSSTFMRPKDWLYGVFDSYSDAVEARWKAGDSFLEIIETFYEASK